MEMLNQSAAEVFFVMENQEAGEVPKQARNDNPEEEETAVIQADTLPDQLLQESVEQENARADHALEENLRSSAGNRRDGADRGGTGRHGSGGRYAGWNRADSRCTERDISGGRGRDSGRPAVG